jgi:hypothetical protein
MNKVPQGPDATVGGSRRHKPDPVGHDFPCTPLSRVGFRKKLLE